MTPADAKACDAFLDGEYNVHKLDDASLFYALLLRAHELRCEPAVGTTLSGWTAVFWKPAIKRYGDTPIAVLIAAVVAYQERKPCSSRE